MGLVFALAFTASIASAQANYPPGSEAECIRTLDEDGKLTTTFRVQQIINVVGIAPGDPRCGDPDAIVTLGLSSDPVVLGRTRIDAKGDYSTQGLGMRIPEGTSPGSHTVTATTRLNNREVTYSQGITVVAGTTTPGLPTTGQDIAMLALWGVLLLAIGSTLTAATWRRWRAARMTALLAAEGRGAPPRIPNSALKGWTPKRDDDPELRSPAEPLF